MHKDKSKSAKDSWEVSYGTWQLKPKPKANTSFMQIQLYRSEGFMGIWTVLRLGFEKLRRTLVKWEDSSSDLSSAKLKEIGTVCEGRDLIMLELPLWPTSAYSWLDRLATHSLLKGKWVPIVRTSVQWGGPKIFKLFCVYTCTVQYRADSHAWLSKLKFN